VGWNEGREELLGKGAGRTAGFIKEKVYVGSDAGGKLEGHAGKVEIRREIDKTGERYTA